MKTADHRTPTDPPDGSRFECVRQADRWTGRLVVQGHTFEGEDVGAVDLYWRLVDVWQGYVGADLGQGSGSAKRGVSDEISL